MDDRISAYKTITFLEKRAEDGLCIDKKCHQECINDLNKAIISTQLAHKQVSMKSFDGLLWVKFIGQKLMEGNKKLVEYKDKAEIYQTPSYVAAYNFWLGYTRFWQILYDEACDALLRDYNMIQKEISDGVEQAFKEFVEYSITN